MSAATKKYGKNPEHRALIVRRCVIAASVLVLLATSCLITLQSPLNPLSIHHPSFESSLYIYAGTQILDGIFPYRDLLTFSGPLVFVINSTGYFLGGETGIWIIETVCLAATFLLIYYSLNRHVGPISAFIATFTVAMIMSVIYDGGNLSTEYAMFFQALGLAGFLNYFKRQKLTLPSVYMIGIGASLAFCIKPLSLVFWVPFFIIILIRLFYKERAYTALTRMIAIFIAFAIIFIAVIPWLSLNKALDSCIDQMLFFYLEYLATISGGSQIGAFVFFGLSLPFLLTVVISIAGLIKMAYLGLKLRRGLKRSKLAIEEGKLGAATVLAENVEPDLTPPEGAMGAEVASAEAASATGVAATVIAENAEAAVTPPVISPPSVATSTGFVPGVLVAMAPVELDAEDITIEQALAGASSANALLAPSGTETADPTDATSAVATGTNANASPVNMAAFGVATTIVPAGADTAATTVLDNTSVVATTAPASTGVVATTAPASTGVVATTAPASTGVVVTTAPASTGVVTSASLVASSEAANVSIAPTEDYFKEMHIADPVALLLKKYDVTEFPFGSATPLLMLANLLAAILLIISISVTGEQNTYNYMQVLICLAVPMAYAAQFLIKSIYLRTILRAVFAGLFVVAIAVFVWIPGVMESVKLAAEQRQVSVELNQQNELIAAVKSNRADAGQVDAPMVVFGQETWIYTASSSYSATRFAYQPFNKNLRAYINNEYYRQIGIAGNTTEGLLLVGRVGDGLIEQYPQLNEYDLVFENESYVLYRKQPEVASAEVASAANAV